MDQPHGITIDWASPATPAPAIACRNCGQPGAKPVLLTAHAHLPGQPGQHVRFLECPACACAFVEAPPGYDYARPATDRLSMALYAEAGAGLWPIVRTLARLTTPPNAAYLEIGCGFGFGLDFAQRARFWHARGIDPSPMGPPGAAQLGVAIESRFFGALPEDTGTADIIMASEVLEHIDEPRAFLTRLHHGLAPGGVLVLTTPDRAALRPATPLAALIPILSVGAHLVLQTGASLHASLAAAGFTHIRVTAEAGQLTAYASVSPLRLNQDAAAHRQAYRGYLDARIPAITPATPLWWGFASRAYQEAVADADTQAAGRLWKLLRAACQHQFGLDPDQPEAAWPAAAPDLAGLAARAPLSLPSLLYCRALQRLHTGATLADTAGLMRAAAAAAAALNAVLAALGATDLATLAVQRAALANLAALAADAAAPDALDTLRTAMEADPESTLALARRCYVGLVNAGAVPQAEILRQTWPLDEASLLAADPATLPAVSRDVLFCLGIAALQTAGAEADAIACFVAARAASAVSDIWWAALRGECVAHDRAGEHAETDRLLSSAPAAGMPEDLFQRMGRK